MSIYAKASIRDKSVGESSMPKAGSTVDTLNKIWMDPNFLSCLNPFEGLIAISVISMLSSNPHNANFGLFVCALNFLIVLYGPRRFSPTEYGFTLLVCYVITTLTAIWKVNMTGYTLSPVVDEALLMAFLLVLEWITVEIDSAINFQWHALSDSTRALTKMSERCGIVLSDPTLELLSPQFQAIDDVVRKYRDKETRHIRVTRYPSSNVFLILSTSLLYGNTQPDLLALDCLSLLVFTRLLIVISFSEFERTRINLFFGSIWICVWRRIGPAHSLFVMAGEAHPSPNLYLFSWLQTLFFAMCVVCTLVFVEGETSVMAILKRMVNVARDKPTKKKDIFVSKGYDEHAEENREKITLGNSTVPIELAEMATNEYTDNLLCQNFHKQRLIIIPRKVTDFTRLCKFEPKVISISWYNQFQGVLFAATVDLNYSYPLVIPELPPDVIQELYHFTINSPPYINFRTLAHGVMYSIRVQDDCFFFTRQDFENKLPKFKASVDIFSLITPPPVPRVVTGNRYEVEHNDEKIYFGVPDSETIPEETSLVFVTDDQIYVFPAVHVPEAFTRRRGQNRDGFIALRGHVPPHRGFYCRTIRQNQLEWWQPIRYPELHDHFDFERVNWVCANHEDYPVWVERIDRDLSFGTLTEDEIKADIVDLIFKKVKDDPEVFLEPNAFRQRFHSDLEEHSYETREPVSKNPMQEHFFETIRTSETVETLVDSVVCKQLSFDRKSPEFIMVALITLIANWISSSELEMEAKLINRGSSLLQCLMSLLDGADYAAFVASLKQIEPEIAIDMEEHALSIGGIQTNKLVGNLSSLVDAYLATDTLSERLVSIGSLLLLSPVIYKSCSKTSDYVSMMQSLAKTLRESTSISKLVESAEKMLRYVVTAMWCSPQTKKLDEAWVRCIGYATEMVYATEMNKSAALSDVSTVIGEYKLALANEQDGSYLGRVYADRLIRLGKVEKAVEYALRHQAHRKEAFVTTLLGASCVGKSTIANTLADIGDGKDGLQGSERATHQAASKYADEVTNQTNTMFLDDMAALRPDACLEQSTAALQILYAITGNIPLGLPKADVDSKGNVSFYGRQVFVTSNGVEQLAKLATSPGAVYRRLGSQWQVTYNPTVLEAAYGEVREARFVDQRDLLAWRGKEAIPEYLEFWKIHYVEVNNIFKPQVASVPLSASDFLVAWQLERDDHFSRQEAAMNFLKTPVALCSECNWLTPRCKCICPKCHVACYQCECHSNQMVEHALQQYTISRYRDLLTQTEAFCYQLTSSVDRCKELIIGVYIALLFSLMIRQVVDVVPLCFLLATIAGGAMLRIAQFKVHQVQRTFTQSLEEQTLAIRNVRQEIFEWSTRVWPYFKTFTAVTTVVIATRKFMSMRNAAAEKVRQKELEETVKAISAKLEKSRCSREDKVEIIEALSKTLLRPREYIFQEPTPNSEQNTITMDQLAEAMNKHLYSFTLSFVDGDERVTRGGNAQFLCDGLCTMNAHYIRDIPDGVCIEITFSNKWFTPPPLRTFKSQFDIFEDSDCAVLSAPIGNAAKDFTKYLSNGEVPFNTLGTFRRVEKDGRLRDYAITMQQADYYNKIAMRHERGVEYNIPGGSKPGYCGGFVLGYRDKRTFIVGIHRAGDPGTERSGAAVITAERFEQARQRLRKYALVTQPPDSTVMDKKIPLTPHSVVGQLGTSVTVLGTGTSTSTPRGTLVEHKQSQAIQEIMGVKATKAPAVMSRQGHLENIKEALIPVCAYDIPAAEAVLDDMMRTFKPAIEAWKQMPDDQVPRRPLTFVESVLGITSNNKINGINFKTSAGPPFFCQKSKIIEKDEEGRIFIDDSLFDILEKERDNLALGMRSSLPSSATLKNELRKIKEVTETGKKIVKTARQFYAAPCAFHLLMYCLVAPIQAFLLTFFNVAESYAAVAPLSRDADSIYQRLSAISPTRIIGGDYKAMDKTIGAPTKIMVREFYCLLAKEMGYQEQWIEELRILLDSLAMPSVLIEGNTVEVPALNISGSLITVQTNGIGGISFGFRYHLEKEFGLLSHWKSKGETFTDHAAILTMGDDHAIAIDETFPEEVNNAWYAAKEATLGRTYTHPDKESELPPFFDLSIEFCQRKFTYWPAAGYTVLAYKWRNFVNTLCHHEKKLSPMAINQRFLDTLFAMRIESLPHGEEEYVECMRICEALMKELSLPIPPWTAMSYTEACEDFLSQPTQQVYFQEHMSEERETFTDPVGDVVGSGPSEALDLIRDPFEMVTPGVGTEMANFFSREIIVHQSRPETGALDVIIYPIAEYLWNTNIGDRIKTYTQVRGTVKARIVISCSGGHYGYVVASTFPGEFGSNMRKWATEKGAHPALKNAALWEAPHQVLQLPGDTEITAQIPIQTRHGSIDIPALELGGSTLWIRTLHDIQHVQSEEPITLTVYLSMPDAQLIGASSIMEEQAEQDAPKGRLSGVLSATASFAEFASTVMPWAIPAEVASGLRTSASVAALLGLSRPSDLRIIRSQPTEIGLMSTFNTPEIVKPLGLDSVNQVGFGPQIPGDKPETMLIQDIMTKESYIGSFLWTATDAIDKSLMTLVINPMMGMVVDGQMLLSNMGFVANLFQRWHGTINIRLQMSPSTFHRGQLVMYFDPLGDGGKVASFPTLHKTIVTLGQLDTITYKVRWTSPQFVKDVRKPGYISAIDRQKQVGVTDNGILVVKVLSGLVSTSAITTKPITVSVFVSADPDMVFGVPRNPMPNQRLVMQVSPTYTTEGFAPRTEEQPKPDVPPEIPEEFCAKCDRFKRRIARKACKATCEFVNDPWGLDDVIRERGSRIPTVQGSEPVLVGDNEPAYGWECDCTAYGPDPTPVAAPADPPAEEPSEAPASRWWPTQTPIWAPKPTSLPVPPTRAPDTSVPTTAPVGLDPCESIIVPEYPTKYTVGADGVRYNQFRPNWNGPSQVRMSGVFDKGLITLSYTAGTSNVVADTVDIKEKKAYDVVLNTTVKTFMSAVTVSYRADDFIVHGGSSQRQRSTIVRYLPTNWVGNYTMEEYEGEQCVVHKNRSLIKTQLPFDSTCGDGYTGVLVEYIGNLRFYGKGLTSAVRTTALCYSFADGTLQLDVETAGTSRIFSIMYLTSGSTTRDLVEHMDSTSNDVEHNMHEPIRKMFFGEGVANLRALLKRYEPCYKQWGKSGNLPVFPATQNSWHSYIWSAYYGIRGGYRIRMIVSGKTLDPFLFTVRYRVHATETTAFEKEIIRGMGQITVEIPYYGQHRFEQLVDQANDVLWKVEPEQEVTVEAFYSAAEDSTGVIYQGLVLLQQT